jgi:hypothetical protein
MIVEIALCASAPFLGWYLAWGTWFVAQRGRQGVAIVRSWLAANRQVRRMIENHNEMNRAIESAPW